MTGMEYRVVDRSILLPAYRRWFVDPVLPLLPRTLDPNTITHAGHVANLAGMVLLWVVGQDKPWACAVAFVSLQFYLWCDNADGAHARRTGQTSVYGEFLDHGLDQLNTAYIGCLTAMAMAVSPTWFVATVLLTSGAAVVTYWEQSVTGVFRLGLLNQVESLMVLSLALGISGVLGPDVWAIEPYPGISIRGVMLGWMTTTILFGAARALLRVSRAKGAASTAPIAAFIGLSALIVAAAATGRVPWWSALAAAAALDVFYGMRMLSLRFAGRPPRLEPVVVAGALLATTVLVAGRWGPAQAPSPATMLALAIVLVALTVREARRGLAHLAAPAVLLFALALALPTRAADAQPPCRELAPLLADAHAVRTPIALPPWSMGAQIERVEFPRSKTGPVVAAKGMACPATPAGALGLDVLPPIETPAQARDWLHAFADARLIERPWPVLMAMVAQGGELLAVPGDLEDGVSLRGDRACSSVVVEEEGGLVLAERCYRLSDGATDEVALSRLNAPPELSAALDGPMVPSAPPEVRADYAAAITAVRAVIAADAPQPDGRDGAALWAQAVARAKALGACATARERAAVHALLDEALGAAPGLHSRIVHDRRLAPLHGTVAWQRLIGRSTRADAAPVLAAVTWWGDGLWLKFDAGGSFGLRRRGAPLTDGRFTLEGARVVLEPTEAAPLEGRIEPDGALVIEGLGRFADAPARCPR